MKTFVRKFAAVLGVCTLAACATDSPTEIGGSLLSSGDLVTFEVLVPASQFLLFDSAFTGYAKATDANFEVVAKKYDGATDANTLLRFSLPPSVISVRTTGSTFVPDSSPHYYAGNLVLHLDTVRAVRTRPAKLSLYRTAEPWDASATWINRVDSLNKKTPWTTPGGTRGVLIDTVTWTTADSAAFKVDSATLALWRDSTNASRGAIIVAEDNGAMVRVVGSALHVSTHSTLRADTVINVDLVPTIRTFVFNPTLTAAIAGVRVGGIPAWRTVLQMRPDLAGRTYPCGAGAPAGCTVTLDSLHLSVAQLILKPIRPPAGFAPEDSMVIESRALAPSSTVPLARAPLGVHLGYSSLLSAALLTNPSPTDVVKVDITSFIMHLTNPAVKPADQAPAILALLQIPEPTTYGFAAFDPNVTLRLVLTSSVGNR